MKMKIGDMVEPSSIYYEYWSTPFKRRIVSIKCDIAFLDKPITIQRKPYTGSSTQTVENVHVSYLIPTKELRKLKLKKIGV